MKYAVINSNSRILSLHDTEPKLLLAGQSVIVLTEVQEQAVADQRLKNPRSILFLIDDVVMNFREKQMADLAVHQVALRQRMEQRRLEAEQQRQAALDALPPRERVEKIGIPAGGFVLPARLQNRLAFIEKLVVLREAENLAEDKAAFLATPQLLVDFNGEQHLMDVTKFREVLVEYGLAYKAACETVETAPENQEG